MAKIINQVIKASVLSTFLQMVGFVLDYRIESNLAKMEVDGMSRASEVKLKAMMVAMKKVMMEVEAFRAMIYQALFVIIVGRVRMAIPITSLCRAIDSRVLLCNAISIALSFLVDSWLLVELRYCYHSTCSDMYCSCGAQLLAYLLIL